MNNVRVGVLHFVNPDVGQTVVERDPHYLHP